MAVVRLAGSLVYTVQACQYRIAMENQFSANSTWIGRNSSTVSVLSLKLPPWCLCSKIDLMKILEQD